LIAFGLGRVAERRRRAVGVDVADPRGLDLGALEGGAHHLRDADRLGSGAAMWYASFEVP
jgi:hypothetical protein